MSALEFIPVRQWLAENRADKIVFCGHPQDLTAGELRRAAALLCAQLKKQPGQRMALICEDGARFVLGLIAAAMAGKTVILLPEGAEDFLAEHHEYFDAVLSDRDYNALPCPCTELTFKISLDSADAEAAALADFCPEDLDLKTPIVLFTSGSTGAPKLIEKTFELMERESRLIFETIGARLSDTVLISSIYPQHLYGLTFRTFVPLCCGIPALRQQMHYTEEICALPPRRYTFLSSPSFLRHLDFELPAPDIALTISSAGLLPYDTAFKVQKWTRAELCEIYGSTECGVMGWRIRDNPKTYFTAFAGVSFTMGQQSYLLHSPITAQEETILHDILEFNPDGTFKPSGRFDSIIKIDEKRISLQAVKAALLECREVEDAEAVTYQCGDRLFIGAVVVLRRAYRHPDEADGIIKMQQRFRAHIAAKLGYKAQPRRFVFIDQIPENSLGKRVLAKLQQYFSVKAAC